MLVGVQIIINILLTAAALWLLWQNIKIWSSIKDLAKIVEHVDEDMEYVLRLICKKVIKIKSMDENEGIINMVMNYEIPDASDNDL